MLDSIPAELVLVDHPYWFTLRDKLAVALDSSFPNGDEEDEGYLLQESHQGRKSISVELPAEAKLNRRLLDDIFDAVAELLPGCHVVLSFPYGSRIRALLLSENKFYSNFKLNF